MSLHRAFADSPRPVVLLLGWLGSREQHFNKYVRLYQVTTACPCFLAVGSGAQVERKRSQRDEGAGLAPRSRASL